MVKLLFTWKNIHLCYFLVKIVLLNNCMFNRKILCSIALLDTRSYSVCELTQVNWLKKTYFFKFRWNNASYYCIILNSIRPYYKCSYSDSIHKKWLYFAFTIYANLNINRTFALEIIPVASFSYDRPKSHLNQFKKPLEWGKMYGCFVTLVGKRCWKNAPTLSIFWFVFFWVEAS